MIFNRCGCGRIKSKHDEIAFKEPQTPNEIWEAKYHAGENGPTNADGEIIFINNYHYKAKV